MADIVTHCRVARYSRPGRFEETSPTDLTRIPDLPGEVIDRILQHEKSEQLRNWFPELACGVGLRGWPAGLACGVGLPGWPAGLACEGLAAHGANPRLLVVTPRPDTPWRCRFCQSHGSPYPNVRADGFPRTLEFQHAANLMHTVIQYKHELI